jgi:hypothetical protein
MAAKLTPGGLSLFVHWYLRYPVLAVGNYGNVCIVVAEVWRVFIPSGVRVGVLFLWVCSGMKGMSGGGRAGRKAFH